VLTQEEHRLQKKIDFSRSRNNEEKLENRGAGAEANTPLFSGILSTLNFREVLNLCNALSCALSQEVY
jgi:hypothetical protein